MRWSREAGKPALGERMGGEPHGPRRPRMANDARTAFHQNQHLHAQRPTSRLHRSLRHLGFSPLSLLSGRLPTGGPSDYPIGLHSRPISTAQISVGWERPLKMENLILDGDYDDREPSKRMRSGDGVSGALQGN